MIETEMHTNTKHSTTPNGTYIYIIIQSEGVTHWSWAKSNAEQSWWLPYF